MDADKAAQELKVIRQLMQRPVRYSTMSGLSGIFAGIAALAGVLADWCISETYGPKMAVPVNVAVWAGVFAAAFLAATVLTRLREIKQGMPFWSDVKRRILQTIGPPFLAAIGLTGAIAYRSWVGVGPNMWGLIPAIWMLFYGVTLWQLGLFSPIDVRLLGAAFLLAGLVAAVGSHTHPYWAMGITFGGFHIVYGIAVWVRHGG